MMIRKRAVAAAVAALTLSLPVTIAKATEARPSAVPQVTPTGVAVSTPQLAGGPAPDNGGELLVLSNEEYTRRFGDPSPRTAGVLVPPGPLASTTPVPQDPQQPWHKVNWSVRDWDGNDIPTRHGTTDFGWLHASSTHNMRSEKAIDAAYHGNADKVTGNRAEYWAVVVTNNGQVRMTTVSIAERGNRGPAGVPTPDGRPIGTITAYCRGQTLCPDWINTR
ncbi:hypothetical protein [Streptomyces sp. NPDC058623]|uniref:hypothetical protein n=1 Tax=Streptomyces sp. NPDC058623 TaxID=3346563 RepID=UPI0036486B50